MAADAARIAVARGRSTSPGQYGSHGYRHASHTPREESLGQRAASIAAERWDCAITGYQGLGSSGSGPLAAWPEAGAPSPRTPRQPQASSEFRMNVALQSLQRQGEAERRTLARQVQQLERKLQDQMAAPSTGRERWADLQGSVSGLLEEMSALVRRVDGLDERLRARSGQVEELVRQKAREHEQALHTHAHKAQLSATTSEEMLKRQAVKFRRLQQSHDDMHKRLEAAEDLARGASMRPDGSTQRFLEMEARLAELEDRHAAQEEEMRGLTHQVLASNDGRLKYSGGASNSWGARSIGIAGVGVPGTHGGDDGLGLADDDRAGSEDDERVLSSVRAVERDLAAYQQRITTQLDEHSASLASLRVRADGQEQRLSASAERLESALTAPLDALRHEMHQLRDHDRREHESRHEHFSQRIQATLDAHEEAASELRSHVQETRNDLVATNQSGVVGQQASDLTAIVHRLQETTSMQEQAIRRLEARAAAGEPHPSEQVNSEDMCRLLARADETEHRLELLEQGIADNEIHDKADRTEVQRLESSLRDLAESVRRVSEKGAKSDARAVALERRVEQLQERHAISAEPSSAAGAGSGSVRAATATPGAGGSPKQASSRDAESALSTVTQQLGSLTARVLDLESTIGDSPRAKAAPRTLASAPSSSDDVVAELRDSVTAITKQVSDLDAEIRAVSARTAVPNSQKEVKELDSRLANLEKRIGAIDNDIKTFSTLHSNHDKSAASLVQRIDGVEKGNKASENMLQQLKSSIEDVKKGSQNSDKVVEQLKTKLEGLDAEKVHDAHSRVGSLEKSVSEVKSQVQQLQRSQEEHVESSSKAISKASQNSANDDALERISEVKNRLQQLEKKHEDHVEWSKKATSQDSPLSASKKAAAGQETLHRLASVEDRLESLDTENLRGALGISSLEKGVADCKSQLQQLQKSHDEHAESSRKAISQASQNSANNDALDRISDVKKHLQQLEKKHEDHVEWSKKATAQDTTLSDRVSEAMEKAACGEEALRRLASVEDSQKGIRQEVDQLKPSCMSTKQTDDGGNAQAIALRQEVSDMRARVQTMETSLVKVQIPSELETQVAELSKKVAAELKDLSDHQHELGRWKDTISSASQRHDTEGFVGDEASNDNTQLACKMETKIEELAKQVAVELDALSNHQLELRQTKTTTNNLAERVSDMLARFADDREDQAKFRATLTRQLDEQIQHVAAVLEDLDAKKSDLVVPADRPGMAKGSDQDEAPSGLHAQVEALSTQVATELRELKDHQKELRMKATAGKSDDSKAPHSVEAQVEKLSEQVLSELQALTKHQGELARSNATMKGLSDKVEDVQRITFDLRKQFELLRNNSASAGAKAGAEDHNSRRSATETSSSHQVSSKGPGDKFDQASSVADKTKAGPNAVKSSGVDSDSHASYEDDFDEAFDEDSA
eukprot:gnl/TRDRNA2_/TRDRNA2_159758_c0_seq2.p1 gnl/TRDRNA2_/TRDRNA2_159758_c0~~gnl/TRDRNA2_/TRDRNA2_159758_c0_seq2.p1  ORF type:complete len:1484 (+),score=354.52 gnl/TRDRNA2_/TRDRNA2_159758_c0_seq2:165-4454(+)